MNFADIRKKFSGGDRAASADPSRAFGSEAEMMQALRRQEFTPPKSRPTAAEVMGSIRQRFARPAEEMQDRIPRDEATARTYAPEAMAQPEWENPFTAPEKPKKPARDVPVYETVGGDMPFERRSAPAYIPQSYAPQQGYDPYGGYAAPYPPAGYEPYAAVPHPPQGYAAPAYGAPYYDPYAAPAYDPRYNAPYPPNTYYAPQPPYPPYPPQGYAPTPEAPYAPPPEYAASAYGAPDPMPTEYAASAYAPDAAGAMPYPPQRPAAPVKPKRKPLEGADLRYVLWSGSIVSGVLLTLVAFVYACTL